MWGEHEIDWILMCAPGRNVDFALNPNEVNAIKSFTQDELRAWMATRKERGEEVSPWFGCMEASGLLYSWWDSVLAGNLKPVLQRDIIHRQQDLEARALGKPIGSVAPPRAFVSCEKVTHKNGTYGPLTIIKCGEPKALPKVTAVAGQRNNKATSNSGASNTGNMGIATATANSVAKKSTAAYVPGSSATAPKQGAYGKVKIHKESMLSQVSHLDELVVMLGYGLGLVQPVKVADLTGTDISPEYAWCEDMLCKVSRSFAMVIQQLPLALRTSICVFYLVLRGLDTVEDDMEAYKDRKDVKVQELRTFYQILTDPNWNKDGVGEGHELELLQNFSKVNKVFLSLSKIDQDVIADICRRMGEGMAEFSDRNLVEGTIDIPDYNKYCHYVAGLVGHGLSHLFVAHGEDEIVGRDLDLANEMGLFLQKTNIIRDYLEDYVDGRAFWPKEIWGNYANKLGDFATMVGKPVPGFEGQQNRDRALSCLNHLLADALTLAPRCLRYMERLHNPDIFKFCAIPQVMAIATLDKLANNPDVFTGVVKIRKGQALSLMRNAGTMTSVYTLFLKYARSIQAAIPPHHKVAYEMATRATKEVEEICLRNLPNGAAALALSPFFSTQAMFSVIAVLAYLLQYLYKQSKTWGDGANTYMPRITDSVDVAAVVGAVFCIGYLFAVGGAPLAFGRSNSGLTPPSSPSRKNIENDSGFSATAKKSTKTGTTNNKRKIQA